MSLKDQFIKISDLVRYRRVHISSVPGAEVHTVGWTPKEVHLKPGQVVHIRCLSDKRSALSHPSPVAIIRMKDVASSSFIQNYKE